ncbi:TonB-dependent receptor [Ponticaulis sp.]|uniref:TonB-dependent receptor n=1 Tax=Ponticaulis sp. TaxID=2020902 RepID=UPI000B70797C|nr:TonB-dependent receptor [Ponticaulis sp.]MAI90347.1 TonB-dependent receptor [Ponticaulis sp.]OUX99983.1 MAG: TonB-dependent receptor [Hyphomonadaceae bacterium TMED5]|tara:strand:+ start:319062 stop:321701 length:2640 start_codon:yes stop_codon:yes gene_type:complete
MTLKKLMMASTAFLFVATPAFAQTDAASAEEDQRLDTVEVIGSQLSRQRGIDDKRNALSLIDALSVDELGQLPDHNVGESLNRIAGVSMLVEKGEGRYVQIRGINPSLNNVTINGANIGSPETEGGGRNAPLDIISGGVLGAVQVIKAPTADMDAQGIGGTVNIETRSPFDREEDFWGYGTIRYGFEEIEPMANAYGGEDPYGLDATLSGKFGEGRFGWLLAASWSDREYIAPGFYQDDWAYNDADATTGSVGGYAPENVKNNYYVIGRERLNVNGVFEYRPDNNSRYFARAFYASWDEFQHRNRYEQNFDTDIVFDTATSGTSGENRIAANLRLEDAEKEVLTLAFGGENIINDFTLNYELTANQNSIDEPYSYWEWRSGRDFGPNSFTINGDGIVSITPDAGTPDRQDASLIDFRRARFQDSHMDEDGLTGQFDLRWDMDADTWFKTGLKARETERSWDFSRTRYDGGSLDLNLGTSSTFTNGIFTNCIDQGCAPNIFMDVDAMNAFFNDPANAAYFEQNTSDTFVQEYSSDYDITERVIAAYGMGVHTLGPVELIAGLRMEATDVESSGYLLEDDQIVGVSNEGDYVSWLPSVLANWNVTENLIVRGSVTRALGRPDFDDIAPRASYSEELGNGSLSVGNPELEARMSWNFDASIEWYPNDLTLLSAAVFYKDIEDDLVGLSERYTTAADIEAALAANGLAGAVDTSILTELNISTTVNGGSSTLQGLELIAQTQLDDFLPDMLHGIGVTASATFLDGETEVNGQTLPLLNQAEETYAVSFFYQNHGFDASLSYAYNGSFLTDVNLSDPDVNLYQGEFGRWDARLSYEVRDGLKVFLEGVNLNDEPTTEFQGGDEYRNSEYEYVGRTVYLGASYGF